MNIGILTMSLNIGGAETHIFELACALKDKGHKVTVFSAGGVYADKLEQYGIRHIVAPLNRKNPVALSRAYRIIDDYVKNNRPCVLHSHARISNYTANKISKKYNVPFVSTVHFNFSTGFFQKMFSKWGNRAIAVSDDLKKYLTDNYKFDKNKVSVTVNGINLNTFLNSSDSNVRKELGIAEDSKVILCVSRLDRIAADHVYKVMSMAQEIYKSNHNSNIVIVGSGARFDEFSKIAQQINDKTKPGFITLAGAQTDIWKFCNIADLFIGISRSALEAMACRVPVILLGNSGYIGVYSDKTKEQCIQTNFTCRGCPFPDDKQIISLINDMLQNPQNYSDNIEKGFDIVKDRYSIERMTDDAIEAYTKAFEDVRPYDAMICGYYGRHNLGDDILLKVITDNLKEKCNIRKITLLTADASDNPCNLDRCIHRFKIPQIKSAMKRTKIFVLGGGSILQDATSSRSLYYYLYVTALAKKLGCKVIVYSNGIGPINKKWHLKKVAKLLEKADYITVRDSNSYEYMRKIGIKNQNIEITADEVFAINTSDVKEYPLDKTKDYVCINLRSASCSDEFIQAFARAVSKFCKEKSLTPVLLPMHFKQDTQALCKLAKQLDGEFILIDKPLPHESTLSVLGQSKFAIIERLHAVIFSCIFKKPFTAIDYDPKVHSLCEELDMLEYMVDAKETDSQKIFAIITKMAENESAITQTISTKADEKRSAAQRNCEIVKRITK